MSTRLRRYVVAFVTAALAFGMVARADDDDIVHVSVQSGEGVWQVAQRLCPSSVFAAYQALIRLNPWVVETGLDPGTVLHWEASVCPTSSSSSSVALPTSTTGPLPTSTTSTTTSSSTTTAPTTTTTSSTSTTTTLPPQSTINVGTTTFRTSSLGALPTETVGGVTYEVIANRTILVDGGYFLIDEPNILIRDSRVVGGRLTVNTGAMIQTSSAARNVRVERTAFDGGSFQNRGIQSDTANLYVYNSTFHRTGNAAVEKNDRNQQSDFVVEGSTVTGTGGWPTDDHVDGLQVGGARNVTIRNNTFDLAIYGGTPGDASYVANSCLGLWAELGNTGTTLVEGNDFRHCGGSVMYLEQKSPYRWTSTVTVRNNTFGDVSAVWFLLAPVGLPTNLTWTGNQMDNGTPLTLAAAKLCCVGG